MLNLNLDLGIERVERDADGPFSVYWRVFLKGRAVVRFVRANTPTKGAA
jgi:hypothetical protein